MAINFTNADVAFAKKVNYELLGKFLKASESNPDVLLTPPPVPVQALTSGLSLSDQRNWGFEYLNTNLINENIKKGVKPKRNILYSVVDTMAYPVHSALVNDKQFIDKQYCLDHTADKNGIDGHGHGHHVAGIIFGKHPKNYQLGLGFINGKNYGDYIMAQKGLDSNGAGDAKALANAIYHSLNVWKDKFKNHLLVFNFSWGSNMRIPIIDKAINEALKNGAFINAAAGNNGTEGISYPASHPDLISWGAHDKRGNRATFSQWGSNLTGIAPGVSIWSCYKEDKKYVSWDGTSMATPHGTVAIGHLLKFKEEIKNQKDLIEYLKTNLTDLGKTGRDDEYGYGYPKFDFLLD